VGDKKHVTGDKMSVTDFNDPLFAGKSAKTMASELLRKEFRGPGDTIEAAAYRLQSLYGVDANTVLQGWNREPRGMLTHRWLPLFRAWCAAGLARAEEAYEEKRKDADVAGHQALVRLADIVAGRADRGSK
jgi:hypothetical protein